MKYTGYSLSFCVRDIMLGVRKLEDVHFIITSTACKDEEDWQKLTDQYLQTYWSEQPEVAMAALKYLREKNLIVQPRLANPRYTHSLVGKNGLEWWKEGEIDI